MDSSRFRTIVKFFPLAVVVAAVFPYISGIDGDFVFDDVQLVRDDPFYKSETNPLKCWTRSFWEENKTQGLYRPMTLLSYWLDARVSMAIKGHLWSPVFRFTNLLLHAAVSLMLFFLARRLAIGPVAAAVAALLYAVHPIHVEAVTPTFGRGELLCAFFLLAGLLAHLSSGRRPLMANLLAGAFFALSFMSKEHGAAFLPICILIDAYRFRGRWWKAFHTPEMFRKYSIYVAAAALVFCGRRFFLGSWLPKQQFFDPFIDNIIALSPVPLRVVAAVRLQGLALMKFLYPAVLSNDYSYAQVLPSTTIFDPGAWGTLILFLAVPAIFVKCFPRTKWITVLLMGLFVVSILPGGNFIVPGGTIFAERLQYLPSMWLAIFAGLAARMFLRAANRGGANRAGRKLLIVTLAALLAALSARTILRTLDWRTRRSIAIAGVQSAPKSVKTLNNYAVVMGDAGFFQEAVMACSKALAIHPKYATAYANRGLYLAKMGHLDEAEKDLRQALRLSQLHPAASCNLGIILAQKGKLDEARRIWKAALEAHPNDKNLTRVLAISAHKKQRLNSRHGKNKSP